MSLKYGAIIYIHSMYIKIYIHGFSVINNTKSLELGEKN